MVHLPRALQSDSERQELHEKFDSLSISANVKISITLADGASASHTTDPGPLNVPPSHYPSISAPTAHPRSRRPDLNVTLAVTRPRAVSSPSTYSPPAVDISVQNGAAGGLNVNFALVRPRCQSIGASPPQASQSSASKPQPSDESLTATPVISRVSSSSSHLSASPGSTVRCSGLRKPSNSGRCKRPVKRMPLALQVIHLLDGVCLEEDFPHYCHQHKDQEIIPLQFSPPKPSNKLVTFTGR